MKHKELTEDEIKFLEVALEDLAERYDLDESWVETQMDRALNQKIELGTEKNPNKSE